MRLLEARTEKSQTPVERDILIQWVRKWHQGICSLGVGPLTQVAVLPKDKKDLELLNSEQTVTIKSIYPTLNSM